MIDKRVLGAFFIGLTAITLYTSVDHHLHIADIYGPVANLFVPLISISSFILGSFVSIVFQWGINVIQFEKVVKILPAGEAAVVRVLFKRGPISQAEVVSETGLPKATVSRVLASLESEGLVSRKDEDGVTRVVPKIRSLHPSAQALTRLPGLSEERIIVVVSVLFMFGISLSLLNSFHVLVIEHPLELSLYLLAIEFFAAGAIAAFLVRGRISDMQLEKTLAILPQEERDILRLIHSKKSVTQKELVDGSGVYKMKVSRIVAKLEAAGVIEKKPYGYTNIIRSRL